MGCRASPTITRTNRLETSRFDVNPDRFPEPVINPEDSDARTETDKHLRDTRTIDNHRDPSNWFG